MSKRREFLKHAGVLTSMVPFLTGKLRAAPKAIAANLAGTSEHIPQGQGFKPHWLKQGDGKGGWTLKPAEIQFLAWGDGTVPYFKITGDGLIPFGVALMDNGEVIMAAAWDTGEPPQKPVVAFSRDGGRTWTRFQRIEGGEGRPVVLTYLGKGNLMFQTDSYPQPARQYFSSDYGRTWPEPQLLRYPPNIEMYYTEGNALVDRNSQGEATLIGQAGGSFLKGKRWPAAALGTLRWSRDRGRTWTDQTVPEWQWEVEYQGKSYARGVTEGSLVRAANGWLVAALRTNCDPRFLELKDDNLEGIAVSISKDEGKTWSPPPMRRLFAGGRMHTHLIAMPNGDLVMTYIVRQDMENGQLASYRRGCEAVISHDHGLTWDLAHRYILDGFEFGDGTPYALACGHVFSTLLNDGSILTTYGKYSAKAAALIRWKPTLL